MAMYRHTVQKRARILTRAEFNHVFKVASLTRDPERNQLLLCLSHALGLRVSEMARLTVRDVLFPTGRIRDELTLRAEITKYNRTRTVPISSKRLIGALDIYLEHRITLGIGAVPQESAAYRGLAPDLPLIFSERGTGFALIGKKRLLETGVIETYLACDPLEDLFRRLYRSAGLRGASSHSGRRAYATRLMESGVDIETISHLLGHAELDYTMPYLEVSVDSIRHAFTVALF